MTTDFGEFLALREALFLEIASIVEAAGSAFAQPTELIYMDGKPVPDGAAVPTNRRDSSVPDDVRLTPGTPGVRA